MSWEYPHPKVLVTVPTSSKFVSVLQTKIGEFLIRITCGCSLIAAFNAQRSRSGRSGPTHFKKILSVPFRGTERMWCIHESRNTSASTIQGWSIRILHRRSGPKTVWDSILNLLSVPSTQLGNWTVISHPKLPSKRSCFLTSRTRISRVRENQSECHEQRFERLRGDTFANTLESGQKLQNHQTESTGRGNYPNPKCHSHQSREVLPDERNCLTRRSFAEPASAILRSWSPKPIRDSYRRIVEGKPSQTIHISVSGQRTDIPDCERLILSFTWTVWSMAQNSWCRLLMNSSR